MFQRKARFEFFGTGLRIPATQKGTRFLCFATLGRWENEGPVIPRHCDRPGCQHRELVEGLLQFLIVAIPKRPCTVILQSEGSPIAPSQRIREFPGNEKIGKGEKL